MSSGRDGTLVMGCREAEMVVLRPAGPLQVDETTARIGVRRVPGKPFPACDSTAQGVGAAEQPIREASVFRAFGQL